MHENVFAGMYTMGDRLEPIVDNSLFQGGGRGGGNEPQNYLKTAPLNLMRIQGIKITGTQ